MGKIITRGTAVREVQYDKVLITLEFMAREAESRRAIKKVTEESEAFLKELENAGMDLSEIEAGANSVKKNNWNDDHTVDVTRGFSFDLDYDLAILAGITEIIEDGSYSVNVDFDPYISHEEEIHRELMVEATQNARKKADLIAEATGSKVTGVERIKIEKDNDYIFDDVDWGVCEQERGITSPGGSPHFLKAMEMKYSKIKIPSSVEKEEVSIEWTIED